MQPQQTVKEGEESPGEGQDDGGRTTEETCDSDRLSVDREIKYTDINQIFK